MTTIPQMCAVLQQVLTEEAQRQGRTTHWHQRRGKLDAATFVQTVVLGWMEQPHATLSQLTQMAATLGVRVTGPALSQRFTKAGSELLKGVLETALGQLVAAEPVAIPLLQRFPGGVYVLDSTVIDGYEWQGCGGSGPACALKVQVAWDLLTGCLARGELVDGRRHDTQTATQQVVWPAGSLRLADIGYLSRESLQALTAGGVLAVTRLKAGTVVYDRAGRRIEVAARRRETGAGLTDWPIRMYGVNCRLIALPITAEVAAKRRGVWHDTARRKRQRVSAQAEEWADWTLVVTTASPEMLSAAEVLACFRARWQVELLFKLWKDHGKVDETRAFAPWRILCEVYAKLLCLLVLHWLLLLSSWQVPDRSLRQVAYVISASARLLAVAWHRPALLAEGLASLVPVASTARTHPPASAPATWQLLLDPSLLFA
jgi:hypothetical protein